MVGRPLRVVTFLFTDIVGSSDLWESSRESMSPALAYHDALLREAIESAGGTVIKTIGDGFHAVFESPAAGVRAALSAQDSLQGGQWPDGLELQVRMGLHLGEAEERDGDYYGPCVNRAARVMSLGHGGQVLVSEAVANEVHRLGTEAVEFQDLGSARLKGHAQTERIFQATPLGRPRQFAPIDLGDDRRWALPDPQSTFVGRDDELDDVQSLLLTARLVTITGPVGAGKSRLAVHVANEIADGYDDGCAYVDCRSLLSVDEVWDALAGPGRAPKTDGPAAGRFVAAFSKKEALVLLDNSDPVRSGLGETLDLLSRQCPNVTFLVTVREPLGLSSERLCRLGTLPVPRMAATTNELRLNPGVILLRDRIRMFDNRFSPDEEDIRAMAAVCASLDGLPLAIELAAAQVQVLSLQDLSTRLAVQPEILKSAQGDLHGMIDCAYEELSETEQRVFESLGVCAGGCRLSLAEALCATEDIGPAQTLAALRALVQKSLVHVDPSEEVPRYRLLEPVRLFAQQQVSLSGRESSVRRRHLAVFKDFVAGHKTFEPDSRQAEKYADIAREEQNIAAALRWAVREPSMVEDAAAFVMEMRFYWRDAGKVADIFEFSSALADGDMSALDTRTRMWLLRMSFISLYLMRRLDEGRPYMDRLVAMLDDLSVGDQCTVLSDKGMYDKEVGDWEGAGVSFQRGLDLATAASEQKIRAILSHNMASTLEHMGQLEEAEGHYQEAVRLDRVMGSKDGHATTALALLQSRQGKSEQAERTILGHILEIRDVASQASLAVALEALVEIYLARKAYLSVLRAIGLLEAVSERSGLELTANAVALRDRALDAVSEELGHDAQVEMIRQVKERAGNDIWKAAKVLALGRGAVPAPE